MTFEDVRREVAIANRILAEAGLATGVTASLGHASMRIPDAPDRFAVKGRGYATDVISEMQPEDMVIVDLEGFLVEGPPGATQCYEVKMHSCIYKTHPEVMSVTHVHPRYVVLMSVLQPRLWPLCQEGIGLVAQPLPLYPHTKTVNSEEEGIEVAGLLGEHKAVLLKGHGSATVGDSLEESVLNAYQLEEIARLNYLAYAAEGPGYDHIEDELVQERLDQLSGRSVRAQDLPHFKDLPRAPRPAHGGVWQSFEKQVLPGLHD